MDNIELLQTILQNQARFEESMKGMQVQLSGALNRIDEGAKREAILHDINRKLDVNQANTDQRLKRLEDGTLVTDQRLNQHGREIDEIRQKPVKKWDQIGLTTIIVVVTSLATFILSRLGLK